MMLRAWLLVLCGCSRILGLGDVRQRDEIDAQKFDARPPNPTCPAVGAGVPRFGDTLHQVGDIGEYKDYVEATDHSAMVLLDDHAGMLTLYTAPPNGDLALASLNVGTFTIQDARYAGDGGFAVMTGIETINNSVQLDVIAIAPDATGAWTRLGTLPMMPSASNRMATPTIGPVRHLVYFDLDPNTANTPTLYELAGDATTWTPKGSYPISTIGLTQLYGISTTPDGLALVGSGYAAAGGFITFYTDRPTLEDHFGPVRVLPDVPTDAIVTPYLTANCSELYFGALDRMLYLQQD